MKMVTNSAFDTISVKSCLLGLWLGDCGATVLLSPNAVSERFGGDDARITVMYSSVAGGANLFLLDCPNEFPGRCSTCHFFSIIARRHELPDGIIIDVVFEGFHWPISYIERTYELPVACVMVYIIIGAESFRRVLIEVRCGAKAVLSARSPFHTFIR